MRPLMKKKNYLMLGIFVSIFIVTSIKAAGSAPSVYNSDAKGLLEMLWAKLDEAIVSNYNVGMLVRYHDHEGTNPGDFVSRGLSLGTNGIKNNAISGGKIENNAITTDKILDNTVTAAKLAVMAKTHTVSIPMGSVDAGTGKAQPIFIAPTSGTVTAISFVNTSDIPVDGTNHTHLVIHKNLTADTTGQIAALSNDSSTITHNTVYRPEIGIINSDWLDFVSGDFYTFYKIDNGFGSAINNMLVTLDYVTSE